VLNGEVKLLLEENFKWSPICDKFDKIHRKKLKREQELVTGMESQRRGASCMPYLEPMNG
jgi:hypothetical protein